MNEEKDFTERQQESEQAPDVVTLPAEVLEPTDAPEAEGEAEAPTEGEAPEAEACDDAPEQDGADEAAYEAAAAENKRKTRLFIGVFSAVVALCLVLAALVFFLGGRGVAFVRIYETVRETVRTVFVKDYDEAAANVLLAPQQAADCIKQSTVTVTVRVSGGVGHGAGFFYREADGYTYICTNHHVVEDALEIQAILPDGRVYDATLVGSNAAGDVAVLKIPVTGLPIVALGNSDTLLAGDEVLAVGTPTNIAYAGTVTFGHISAPLRLVPITDASGNVTEKMTLIQTDAALNNGNSGGPLADMYGKVVGMVVIKMASTQGKDVDGIAFALPIDGVKVIADAIIANGSFTGKNPITEPPSALGLSGHGVEAGTWYALDAATGKVSVSLTQQPGYYQASASGVYVSSVSVGSHAVGRMQKGDIILKVDGLRMYTIQDVIAAVNRRYIGERVVLTVWRDGAETTVVVELGAKSAA